MLWVLMTILPIKAKNADGVLSVMLPLKQKEQEKEPEITQIEVE